MRWIFRDHLMLALGVALALVAVAASGVAEPKLTSGYDWQWMIRVGPEECVEHTQDGVVTTHQVQAYYLAPGFIPLQDAAVFAVQAHKLQGPMSGSPFLEPCAVPVVRGGAQGVVR